ncbi:hypothetical protein K438DRAFT_1940768 [Mycena galopus ATCC 62051]|nr:hypothetical protein K438DRAFT_1940768 [Mycena galopus ATCC 62051]
MAPISAFPPGLEIVQLAGPILIAFLADWALFATLTVQLYLYYQAFPNDRLFTKCLVYCVYSIQLVQIVLSTVDAWRMFGSGYGELSALTQVGFAWFTVPFISALDSLIVQSFYAFRIFVLSKSKIIPAFLVVTAMAFSISGFINAGFISQVGNLENVTGRRISTTFAVAFSGSALIDISIAVCMTYYLTKKDTGFRRTRALISKLVRLSIETGTLTALISLATLILFFVFPDKVYYTVPDNIMPMMYANTMFAVLNSRFNIEGGRSTETSPMDLITIPTLQNGVMSGATAHSGPVVSIDRDVFSHRDPSFHGPVEMKVIHEASGKGAV